MQPSDSLVPLGRRSGRPSPTAYPVAPAPPPARATPETLLPRLPTRRLCPEERQGPPRCLGHPLRACRALRPPGCDAPLAPLPVRPPSPSGPPRPSAPGMHPISGLYLSRPARSRAYASPNPLPSPAQGSLPAGRAHPGPGGFRTRWMTYKVSWCHRIRQSSSTSLAWSHRRRKSTGRFRAAAHREARTGRWIRVCGRESGGSAG